MNTQNVSAGENFDAFVAEDALHLIGDIGILLAQKPRPGLMIVTRLPKRRKA